MLGVNLKSLSAWSLIVIYITLTWTNFNIKRWKEANVLDWDIVSYYSYLPAFFIHNDLKLKFTEGKESEYANKHQYWHEKAPNGGKAFKMTMGMAILYSPFFLTAHAIAKIKNYETDGFSEPYEKYIHLSSIFYLFIGLYFLRKSLLYFFKEAVVAIVLLFVSLGTNLFYYATTEAAMSHAYNFSLISIFIFLTLKWHDAPKLKYALLLGLIGGVIVLIRPVNILVFIFPILFRVKNLNDLKIKILHFTKHKHHLLLVLISAFVVCLPQLLYWKYTTGSYLFYSYTKEGFYFTNPQILKGLFSYRKGWLLYTPMMFFAMIGIYFLYKNYRAFFLSISFFTLLYIYIVFSWWCWWYGGSFGLRAMIDAYPVLCFPMAAFFQYFIERPKKYFLWFFIIISLCLMTLNFIQTKQYRCGIIHWDSMTKESYWQSFARLQIRDTTYWNLFQEPDYENALKGEKEILNNIQNNQ